MKYNGENAKNGSNRFAFAALAVLVLAAFACSGCIDDRYLVAAVGSKSKAYQEFMEDPVTLTAITTVAVFPFDNRAPLPGFDADVFANKLANQLASAGQIRVLYPKDVLEFADRENRAARRHNADLREQIRLGLYRPEEMNKAAGDESGEDADAEVDLMAGTDIEKKPRSYYDPVRNMDEAVKLARRAKADAIIMGEVSDFDPYMRPRLSLTMRLIATGSTDDVARELAELTQWGIPRSGSSAKGVVYIRQETFDSAVGSVGLDVSIYGRTHMTDHRAYDTEAYLRSMTMYYDVVTNQLAKAYVDARQKAIKEAERRARAAAKKNRQDENAATNRLMALLERDSRIPDFETDQYTEGYFDQAFPEKNGVVQANGGDKRIMSWRGDGRNIRKPNTGERLNRDARIPENERGPGMRGYPAAADAAFPDADAVMEQNLGDNKDRSWRPDYYNHANPQKAAPMYGPSQAGGGYD